MSDNNNKPCDDLLRAYDTLLRKSEEKIVHETGFLQLVRTASQYAKAAIENPDLLGRAEGLRLAVTIMDPSRVSGSIPELNNVLVDSPKEQPKNESTGTPLTPFFPTPQQD